MIGRSDLKHAVFPADPNDDRFQPTIALAAGAALCDDLRRILRTRQVLVL